MMHSLLTVRSLFAMVALGACVSGCAGSTDSATPGSGGNSGTAGTTGAAGNAGSAGAAGNAGVAGTAGTAGSGGATTGTAGASGTNGTAGTAGTAGMTGTGGSVGAGGRGGTTGAGGSAGSVGAGGRGGAAGASGGRGGASGTAGASGGRGGTTGTAGTGGTGGCTITATSSLSTMIPTVGIVTFTTNLASVDSAEIRFGPASTGPTMTAPVDLTKPSYRTLLLGMKGSSSYVFRIVATSSAGTCTSADYPITTGAVPSSVPKPTTTISNAAAHGKGFIITSSGVSGTGAWIFDSDGAPVWWSTGPSGTSSIEMSWDGSKMYMMALNVQNTNAGGVKIVDMDGANATNVSGMTTAHHDLTAIPGGFATLLWNSAGIDAPCSLVERSDSGAMTTVIANMNTVYNSSTWHTNSVHYHPTDNTYTLGDRNPNLYVKVTRAGQLIWQLGGTNPKDATKMFSGTGTWMVNHGHHFTDDGMFYLFNNGQMGGSSVVRGFKLNTSNLTATSTFTYMGSNVNSMVMGDVQVLPNGNILVTASNSGNITEVTTGMQVVASFKLSAAGYTEYRDSLYGPPPR